MVCPPVLLSVKQPLVPEEWLLHTIHRSTHNPVQHGQSAVHPFPNTHSTVYIFTALLVLLLYSLLQEVDAELEAEVLLLQVIQVLRQSTVTVRHDRQRAPTPLDMSVIGQK